MPRYGCKKLYLDVKDELRENNIKIGRDKFFSIMRTNNLLVRKSRQFHITTNSRHRFFKSPNLIKHFMPHTAEQVWVSDITYIRLQDNHAYLALVTDLYSKKIMGYKLDIHMKASLVKDALAMALKNRIYGHSPIIHHSDRGVQYCAPEFTEYAELNQMILSTTQQYDPYENAVAERINGILKYDFGFNRTLPTLGSALYMIKQAVDIYNHERRHCSLEMETPEFAHRNQQHDYKKYSLN
jgi:transposase InsO family protein